MTPRAPAPAPASAARRLALALAIVITLGCGAASLLGLAAWAAPGAWLLDLCNHFRGTYALGLGLAAGLALALRRRRWLALALALLAVDLALLAPLYLPLARDHSGPGLRLLHFNVLSSNQERARVVAYLGASGADLILLQEVDPGWAAALATVPGYRVAASVPRPDNFGIAALAREGAGVASVSVLELVPGLPALRLDLELDGSALAILSVHTLPPVSAAHAERRDAMLAAAAAWAAARRREGRAPVVIGDLNATPFSGAFRRLLGDGALVSSARGFGLQATWPTAPWYLRPLAIPIDHCLHDARLVALERVIGPALGSDHRPLEVALAWAAGPPP